MEAAFGISGLIAAPIYYAYLRIGVGCGDEGETPTRPGPRGASVPGFSLIACPEAGRLSG
jgi:hypothetical protein